MLTRWLRRHGEEPADGARPDRPLTEAELKAGILRELDVFAGLAPRDLRWIAQHLPMSECVRGGLVTSPDDRDERVYIVKRGRVRLYRLTEDGRQLTLDILDKGRVVGRMSWLGQQLADTYAEAIDDALVCTFTPAELHRLIDRYPIVGLNLVRYLADRLAASEREREILAFRTVEQRLAARLIELSERFGRSEPAGGLAIDARLTQQELADMIGTTRETLAQTVSRLRELGVLEMRSQHVVLLDHERLAALATGADLDAV